MDWKFWKEKFQDVQMDNPRLALVLYKRILRLHRALPPELEAIGSAYVRDEFKRHKDVGPAEAKEFVSQWTDYCKVLYVQVKQRKAPGKDLKSLEEFSNEQLLQLYELKQEATKPRLKKVDPK